MTATQDTNKSPDIEYGVMLKDERDGKPCGSMDGQLTFPTLIEAMQYALDHVKKFDDVLSVFSLNIKTGDIATIHHGLPLQHLLDEMDLFETRAEILGAQYDERREHGTYELFIPVQPWK